MRQIILSKGKIANVDDADFDLLNRHKWFTKTDSKARKTTYAVRNVFRNGKRTLVYMHRELIKPRKNHIVDHIDMNGLNNCRSNLRLSNKSMNALNQTGHRDSQIGMRGVSKSGKKFMARVRDRYLGTFMTAIEAKNAVDNELKKICN